MHVNAIGYPYVEHVSMSLVHVEYVSIEQLCRLPCLVVYYVQITDVASTSKEAILQSCKLAHNYSIQSPFTSSLHSHIVHSAQWIHSTSATSPSCTMTMKIFAKANNNGSNHRNAFTKILLAPAHPTQRQTPLGLDNNECSECDCNVMVHKLNLNITRNGLWPIWQSSIWCGCYLRVKPCNFLSKKGKSLKTKQCTSCRMHQCGVWTLSFQRMLCRHQAQLVKGPSVQCNDHQQVHGTLASTKPLFCPISP